VDGPGNGALTSSGNDDGALADAGRMEGAARTDGGPRLVYSSESVNGVAASSDPAERRRRRRHRKSTRRPRMITRTPKIPPTIAAMGGPLWVADVA